MKVNCKCCGKRFDYDLNFGMCPKCGTYYREGQSQWTSDNNDQKDSGTFETGQQQQNYSYNETTRNRNDSETKSKQRKTKEKKVKKDKKKRRHGVAYYIVSAVLAVIIVVLAYVPYHTGIDENEQKFQEMSVDSSQKAKTYKVGEKFTYSIDKEQVRESFQEEIPEGYYITIQGATTDKAKYFNIPEGYELVVVSYTMEEMGEAVKEEEKEEVTEVTNTLDRYRLNDDEPKSIYDIYMEPYLTTKSGEYIEPINPYNLRDYIKSFKGRVSMYSDNEELSPENIEKVGLSLDFQYTKGVFYFLVKKGDVSGMWINSYNYNPAEYSTTSLRESIEITGLEVK